MVDSRYPWVPTRLAVRDYHVRGVGVIVVVIIVIVHSYRSWAPSQQWEMMVVRIVIRDSLATRPAYYPRRWMYYARRMFLDSIVGGWRSVDGG
jgi:hypothetical protein